jgi:molecular chaperone DnaK
VEVLSTNGDTHLGGEDFDERILDYVAGEFQRDSGIDLRRDKMAIQRLRESAEKAKIELSTAAETEINLPYITADATGPKHLVVKLTRAKFENLVVDLIKRAIDPCRAALADAGLKPQDIQEVIMVGGSTRIPAIRSAVKEFFGREPNNSVNPDEAVALGAAIQAGVLSGDVKDVLLLDVTPLSLGIETLGGVFTRLIDRNTTIPTKKSQVFSTADDNQSAVTIKVSQGEREMARDNKSLGQFDLDGIPPARRGTPQIEVTFDIDANGIVTVSARDQATGKAQHISIKANGGLTDSEIADMMAQAEANREADQQRRALAEARNRADSMMAQADRQIEDGGDNLDAQLVADVRSAEDAVKLRLADTEATAEQLAEVSNKLQEACMKLAESQYKAAQPPPGTADSQPT